MISPKLHIEELRGQCGSLLVKDITGLYSSANTGGYGSPNVTVAQVVKTELLVKFPEGHTMRWNVIYAPNSTGRLEIGQLVPVGTSTPTVAPDCGNPINAYIFAPFCSPDQKPNVDYFAAGCYEFTYNLYTGTALSPVLHASFTVVKFLHCEIAKAIEKVTLDATVRVDNGKKKLSVDSQLCALNGITLAYSAYESLKHDCGFNCECAKGKVELIHSLLKNLANQ